MRQTDGRTAAWHNAPIIGRRYNDLSEQAACTSTAASWYYRRLRPARRSDDVCLLSVYLIPRRCPWCGQSLPRAARIFAKGRRAHSATACPTHKTSQ